MDTSIQNLVRQVNADVAKVGGPDFAVSEESLNELTTRILTKVGGSPQLHVEWLSLASVIVSVCGTVVRLIPLLRGKPPEEQRKAVADELVKQTEDSSVAQNAQVRVVVELAVAAANRTVTVEVKTK